MKVIPVKEKENWIFGARTLKEIFWQDDEKAFFLI